VVRTIRSTYRLYSPPEGYQDKAEADALAEEAEATAFARGHFNCRIVAHLAYNYEAAQQGRFWMSKGK
jgi:hypothetical protein